MLLPIKNKSGRIFFLGVGGSAGNTSHAVNDFRKILNIECYSPTDNVSEITANTNDNGWDSIFINFLKINKSKCKLLWASTRQIYDLISAKKSGCHIITMSTTIYKKKENFKKNWKKFSLETVKGFYNDAKKSKFKIK